MTYLAPETVAWNGIAFLRLKAVRWLLAAFIFWSLLMVVRIKGPGMAMMLCAAGAFALGLTRAEMARCLKAWPVLAFPLLGLLSVVWSDHPAVTFRVGVQFAMTAAIAVMLYRTLSFSGLTSALMSAGVVACLHGLSLDATRVLAGQAFVGISDAKNIMAFIAMLPVLAGVAMATHRPNGLMLRLAGLGGALLGVICVALAQSAGAYIGTGLGVGVILAAHMFVRAPADIRLILVVAMLLLLPVGILAQSVLVSQATTFSEDVLGKDTTLTGRTYMWEMAAQFFAERPVQGRGYAAFWVSGNPDAENIWARYMQPSGSGFNFHNQFVQVAVDLGLLGLTVFVGTLIVAAASFGVRLLRGSAPELPFYLGAFLALVVRLPVEAVMLMQFNIITVLFFMTMAAAIYGHESVAIRLAAPARRSLRRIRRDRGLVQAREIHHRRKRRVLRQMRTAKPAVHGPRRQGRKKTFRQTRQTTPSVQTSVEVARDQTDVHTPPAGGVTPEPA